MLLWKALGLWRQREKACRVVDCRSQCAFAKTGFEETISLFYYEEGAGKLYISGWQSLARIDSEMQNNKFQRFAGKTSDTIS
jgi:hypothetical protein